MKNQLKLAFALLALFSFALVSCTEETVDKPTQEKDTTQSNINKNLVAELHSFIGKPSIEVIEILSQKCSTWHSNVNNTAGTATYKSLDSTKVYIVSYGQNNNIVRDVSYSYYPKLNPRDYLNTYEDFEGKINSYGANTSFSGYIQYTLNHELFSYANRSSYLIGYELKKATMNNSSELISFMDVEVKYSGRVSWSDGTFDNQRASVSVGFSIEPSNN